MYQKKFDIIVVGGGHAGIESAYISSCMENSVLLITYNIKTIAKLSCNPSIGGIGKSNLVKEIDMLGGLMGKLADLSGIQFRILNSSKGYAVRATRVQVDNIIYRKNAIEFLKQKDILIHQDEVISLIIDNNVVKGVKTRKNIIFYSDIVILSLGTFLDSKIFIGNDYFLGGRLFDHSSVFLANFLKKTKLKSDYLKTGTPPRLSTKSLNFNEFTKQKIDKDFNLFSYFHKKKEFFKQKLLPQVDCYITYTNKLTHQLIQKNINNSPLYNGLIKGIGPRYCPSIEDKIIKFIDKSNHHIFLEPENLFNKITYPNGISTSLPLHIQKKMVRSIKGMEKAKIIYPGYAVQYLFFDPKDLYKTLESKYIKNLFLAGQINGTTGYEEAAAQGLIAGINASLKLKNNKDKYIPKRSNSYIGVLIDDLCVKGINEPYRMFTSRSEFRLYLREDNVDYRLMSTSRKFGLINDDNWAKFKFKMENINNIYNFCKKKIFSVSELPKNILKYIKIKNKKITLKYLFSSSKIKKKKIINFLKKNNFYNINFRYIKEVLIMLKYDPYLSKQSSEFFMLKYYKKIFIPNNINYYDISGLSNEVKEKLNKFRPVLLSQAYNISGITPSALIIILIYLKKKNYLK